MEMKEFERSSRLTDDQKKLLEENFEFAKKVAFKSSIANSMNKDDVVDIAIEALIKAVKSFDENRNVKFTSFAYRVIQNHLIDVFKKNYKKEVLTDNVGEEAVATDDLTQLFEIDEKKQKLYEFLIKHQHDREINLLIHRYFNDDDKITTQSELAKFYQLSQPQLSHLERRGKERLRKEFRSLAS